MSGPGPMTGETLFNLLPAVYRLRDAQHGGALRELMDVLAEQGAILEEDLAQLYDDHFVETCGDWAAPYIGSLIGYRALHGVTPRIASPKAEVANTIAYRRRKGAAAMLEQLARDVTGWPARAVEFFERLATTQHMNHVRLHAPWSADLRAWEPLLRVDTAFDASPHTVDVRRPVRGGRYNIPNIGIFLWRLRAFEHRLSPAFRVDARRFRFHPLGADAPLFTHPQAEERITHLAEPTNTAEPILRRIFAERPGDYYGSDLSLAVLVDGDMIPLHVEAPLTGPPFSPEDPGTRRFDAIRGCHLGDGGWSHPEPVEDHAGDPADPPLMAAIDTELGRIAFSQDLAADAAVEVIFHAGFGRAMGGGSYARGARFLAFDAAPAVRQAPTPAHPTIQSALDALPPEGGVVEVIDSALYAESLVITAEAGAAIELRAADERRPVLVAPGGAAVTVRGGADSHVALNGLLIAGGPVRVPNDAGNALRALTVRHCTLVPGRNVGADGAPSDPGAVMLEVAAVETELRVEDSLVGAVAVAGDPSAPEAVFVNSAIDAAGSDAESAPAYQAPGGGFGRALSLDAATVIGTVAADRFGVVSNTIFHSAPAGPGAAPVSAARRQAGCVRFSFVPPGSVTPRQYRCQPRRAVQKRIDAWEADTEANVPDAVRARIRAEETARIRPRFTALRWSAPAYLQLAEGCPTEIAAGADDEAEMGVFHDLYQPQRLTNLRVRLEEYLRFGLEAGVYFET